MLNIQVYRYNPGSDNSPRMQAYVLDTGARDWMVLDVLEQLKHKDASLSFRRSCREGVCGSDGMNINGKNGLACMTRVSEAVSGGETLVLRPLTGMPVIRDLVVDLDLFFRQYKKVRPWLINDNPVPTIERLQSPEDRARLDGLYECILCACCTSGCPSWWWNPERFIGPAGLLSASRFLEDSRDTATEERLEALKDPFSVFRCRQIQNCTWVCPKGLNPMKAIPEAMEQVLLNESRIPARITWLKPLSAAIAIGTGGPFGAEGPIIATGGALGSLLGQLLRVTADERKTLLAAGAAAGMAAVFATPVSAVLLAIELLLFERRARSLIPVALAAVAATGMRFILEGTAAVFAMSEIAAPGFAALVICVVLGALMGLAGVLITKLTYGIEDAFEKLPIHWMWWPALGGLVVGLVGYVMPQTLGVGYDNIVGIVNGQFGWRVLAMLCLLKLLSWSVALGSGTSGGTLAPLFTIGGALGGVAGLILDKWLPWLHLDPRLTALVGMAALFAGASRAFLASVMFAFETTQQVHGLLPLLGACTAAYMVSSLLMRNTIMTEKITRRGVRVPSDYSVDYLDRVAVGDVCSRNVVVLEATQSLSDVRKWMDAGGESAQHQGFPVLDSNRRVMGVITRRNLLDTQLSGDESICDLVRRPPLVVSETHSAREAADHMVTADVGRLIVVADDESSRMVGIVTRGDLLSVHTQRLRETHHVSRHLASIFQARARQ